MVNEMDMGKSKALYELRLQT